MILGILLLLGGGLVFVFAFRNLRAAQDPDWVRRAETRLVISTVPGSDRPQVALWRGNGIAFGPAPASWDPPAGMKHAPVTGSGDYQVSAAIDLSGEDVFGTRDARLAAMLRGAVGPTALLLAPRDGDRPLLLHGTPAPAAGSAVGIAMDQTRLEALLALTGDPAGLRVQLLRRRVQRAGWGGAQGQRHRSRR